MIGTYDEISIEKYWEPESLGNVALEIRGLPKGIDESKIKFYMEEQDENTELVSVNLDSDVATVKIVDATGKKLSQKNNNSKDNSN